MTSIVGMKYETGYLLSADCNGCFKDELMPMMELPSTVSKFFPITPTIWITMAGVAAEPDTYCPAVEPVLDIRRLVEPSLNSTIFAVGLASQGPALCVARKGKRSMIKSYEVAGSGAKHLQGVLRKGYRSGMSIDAAIKLAERALEEAGSKDKYTKWPYEHIAAERDKLTFYTATVEFLDRIAKPLGDVVLAKRGHQVIKFDYEIKDRSDAWLERRQEEWENDDKAGTVEFLKSIDHGRKYSDEEADKRADKIHQNGERKRKSRVEDALRQLNLLKDGAQQSA
jgi:20S proteasome alpha/beta subunit